MSVARGGCVARDMCDAVFVCAIRVTCECFLCVFVLGTAGAAAACRVVVWYPSNGSLNLGVGPGACAVTASVLDTMIIGLFISRTCSVTTRTLPRGGHSEGDDLSTMFIDSVAGVVVTVATCCGWMSTTNAWTGAGVCAWVC